MAEAEINTKLGESSKISEDTVPASAEHTSSSNNLTIRLPRDVYEVIAEINRKMSRPRMNDPESSDDEQPTENTYEGRGRFRRETEESPRRRESQRTNSETIRPENDGPIRRREYQCNCQRQRRQAPIVSSMVDTRRKYEKSIKEGPTLVCVCCGGLFFLKNVSLVNKETMLSKWKCESDVVDVAFWAADNHKFEDLNNITIMKDGNPDKNYFCLTFTTESILTSDNDFTIRLAPGEGMTPISVLTDKDSDFLSFPKVYYGHKLEGSGSVSYGNLAKFVVQRFDRRAAMRPD
ncbi:hypothetical protein INT47_005352 [Mucor saturninus]|uniref:Uncharacterized protein n=1 Tax=Mucor saturninus TaxID=64648 RepID=A0A8H7QIN7_9FUNG|nr:hypothetical protein INT47_005352 [Mucor saturninus]